jgi:hypothetical protein
MYNKPETSEAKVSALLQKGRNFKTESSQKFRPMANGLCMAKILDFSAGSASQDVETV